MASGELVGVVLKELYTGTVYATEIIRVGGSTPAENVAIHDFDGAAIEYRDYLCVLVGYASGGLTVKWKWSAKSATSGTVVWGAAIRRIADDAEDIDASHTYDFNNASAATVPSASGELSYDSVAFTDGADMDSLADGEVFILRMRRDPTNGSDDVTTDVQLWGCPEIYET